MHALKYILCVGVFTRTDDACVEYREVLLAGREGGDGEGATGLGAAAHPPLRWRTGTLSSWTQRQIHIIMIMPFFYSTFVVHTPGSLKATTIVGYGV